MTRERQIASAIRESLIDERIVQAESSARHVHLCEADIKRLFGPGARLTPKRELSQKGEFLCEERVTIITERRTMQNVAVLGPARPESQVELSLTDGVSLGIKLPVRYSGDIRGAPGIELRTGYGRVELKTGCIAAMRHLHATPADALRLGIADGQIISAEVYGERAIVFRNVLVRVRDSFRLRLHLDMDEANAAGMEGFTLCKLIY